MGAAIILAVPIALVVVILMRLARTLHQMSCYYERASDENRLIRLELGKVADELQKIRSSMPVSTSVKNN